MSEFKYIGLVTSPSIETPITLSNGSVDNGYRLKKVFAADPSTTQITESWYPGVEVVADLRDILDDEHIELVVVSGKTENQRELIAMAMAAGKFVRVI